MSVWATRRQLSFVLVFILLLILALVVLLALNRRVPTCSDNIQNQGELGTDCGGPCPQVCPVETNPIITLWTRVFRVRGGVYDVAAYVENPNPFGLPVLPYSIRIYDDNNVTVKDVKGETYLNAHERALIFEPNINVGFRMPTRAFLTFPEVLGWERLGEVRKPVITIRDKILSTSTPISLSARASNNSLFPLGQITFWALLYDASGTVTHVSQTLVPEMADGGTVDLVFTWPEWGRAKTVSADIFGRVNLNESR